MRLNIETSPPLRTHEGGRAKKISPLAELSRSVMACLLWEKEFYEEGKDIADRISGLIPKVDTASLFNLANNARSKMNLRHIPLFIAAEMLKHPKHRVVVGGLLSQIIQRPDELTEFLALYWRNGRCPLANQVKKGLALAFTKFNEYQLAKYNRDNPIKLKDVLFLVHAKPKDKKQAALWKRLVNDELKTPDTWEVSLSAGKDKRKTWERLLKQEKLGGLALLRNLRNMQQVSVDEDLIKDSIVKMKTGRILPFRFIAASRYAPSMEPELEQAMFKNLAEEEHLDGKTAILIDVSGSMDAALSSKSDMTRLDAACGLAMLIREIAQGAIFTFSEKLCAIPNRRGFALRDAIIRSQHHSGTYLGQALTALHNSYKYDRLIVITDEQTADRVPPPVGIGYMINVASAKNGVGYGKWLHLDGFSESIVSYIRAFEEAIDDE